MPQSQDGVLYPFAYNERMGIRRIKTISDLDAIDAFLRITCLGCGRSGDYDPAAVRQIFHHKRLNQAWQVAGQYFKCEECGHKGAHLAASPRPAPMEPPPLISERQVREQIKRERG